MRRTCSVVLMTPDQYDTHRAQQARQAYIAAYLSDLPAVYQTLLPVSYDAAELFEAEMAIRQQVEADVLQLHRRRAGPSEPLEHPRMLDFNPMHPIDRIAFGLEHPDPSSTFAHEYVAPEPSPRTLELIEKGYTPGTAAFAAAMEAGQTVPTR